MTRLEENRMVIEKIIEQVERRPAGKDEGVLQLSIIATVLGDISKSLATLADKIESEG